jgi:hypothetical protein
MDTPKVDLSKTKENTEHVVLAKPPQPTMFGVLKEKFTSLSKNKHLQLGLMLLLIASVPLTVLQGFKQQELRQHASEKKFSDPKYIGTLPPFNDLVDLENQLVAGHKDSQYKIQQSDYAKCPAAVPNQPGWWDPSTVKSQCDGDMCGDSSTQEEKDPVWFFGKVLDGTDPVNDPFYTTGKPNGEARWAGNPRHSVANPHDRGLGYSYGEYVPGVLRVGGWSWEWDKDHACWGISTYQCTLNANKMPAGGGRNGYARAMGWASNGTSHNMSGSTLKNRECILSIAVMETRQEWIRSFTETDSSMRNVNDSLRNPEATGFYLSNSPTTGTNSLASTEAGTTGTGVIRDVASETASCSKDRTFTDVTSATDAEINTAATCLAKKTYCTVRGFEDGTLQPGALATRAYVVAFLTRYHVHVLKDWQFVDLNTIPATDLYQDVRKDYGLALEIYTAQSKGFIKKGDTFNPELAWGFGFKGTESTDYDFTKSLPDMTRGEFIKAVYAYGTTGKGKGQLAECTGNAASGSPTLTDPTPFIESASNTEDNRIKVCGAKSSLLSGHITGKPSVRAFKDKIYVFAPGREDKLYVRALTTPVTASSLSSNPWNEMGKTISGTIITLLQNQEGLPSLSAIVTGKAENKAFISSTTGSTWSPWVANTISQNSLMETSQITSIKNLTYSFDKLCLLISAAPDFYKISAPGGTGTSPAPAKPSNTQTSPVPAQSESFDSCTVRVQTDNHLTPSAAQMICCAANPAYKTEAVCKQLTSPPVTPDMPQPGVGDVTVPQKQNVFQQLWSWLTSAFK